MALDHTGSVEEAAALAALADEYARGAETLARAAVGRGVAAQAPARHCAVHAVELYLSVFLLSKGFGSGRIKAMRHDLSERLLHAMAHGLRLPNGAAQHVIRMSERSEAVALRYAPGAPAEHDPMTRILATLSDLRAAVDVTPPP